MARRDDVDIAALAARVGEMEKRLDERWASRNVADGLVASGLNTRLEALSARIDAIAHIVDQTVTGPQQWAVQRRAMIFGFIASAVALATFLFLVLHVVASGEL